MVPTSYDVPAYLCTYILIILLYIFPNVNLDYISATAGASDFEFGVQLGFAKDHHKITPSIKVGVALNQESSHIFGVSL